MNRAKLNPMVDLSLAAVFIGMILSGYILRFQLAPGSNGNASVWGLSRHMWGQAHFWLAAGLLMMIFTHVVLHWKWIEATLRKRFGFGDGAEVSRPSMGFWAAIFSLAFLTILFWSASARVTPVKVDTETGSSPDWEAKKAQSRIPLTFLEDVQPMLQAKCVGCHGPDRQAGGIRLDQDPPFQKTSGRGPLIVPGYPDSSRIVQFLSGATRDGDSRGFHHISVGELLRIAQWIEDGAHLPSQP